ncbi:MAG TPA: class I SAM-dependent DNA methyltransferase, partial [Fibrobacteria bacterium]|nr:class I SAM-dependent DNA methyltransferase [Fibrobacteria bacterium]
MSVSLREFQETLAPTYALAVARPKEGESPWLLLVQAHPPATDLTKPVNAGERGWGASPVKKFERLLRETGVPIGLLTNGVVFQLVYAPPKENSGILTFPVAPMLEVSGRLILGAFHLLLDSHALFTAPTPQRLPSLLQTSRSYQATVSEKLAEQVLHALYELLRGFASADRQAKTGVLHDLAAKHPDDVYGGLVTVLLRLVFVLFAEDRGLLPTSGLFVRHYSVRGLFERLRADAERYPDTMDHRFGAWAQLLALFRLVHGGCQHPEMRMPAREGHLFDPQRYPFLEGRARHDDAIGALPLVSDGVIYGILEKLCILEGERVSYSTLDVEEIGSVYQTIMGFDVQVVSGTAIALKGKRKKGSVPAAPVVDLEALLELKPADRIKHLSEQADTKLTGEAERAVKGAASVDDLLAALAKRIDDKATPSAVAKGGLVLHPNDERRRSGSHYTPRSFTEPIVRKTLEPVLARLVGPDLATVPPDKPPTPEQILDLKVADIAVGSAAFLVEACRQLGDALVKAWRLHGGRPYLPADET